jgi:predicted Fe-S protein YdhL (DUF1289 family)
VTQPSTTNVTPFPPATTAPASPCVRNCCLDDAEVCLGCGRKLKEILEWHQATPARRQVIVDDAALRVQSRLKRMRL